MLLRFPAWRSIVALSCFVAACGRDATSPPSAPPAAVAALTELTQSGEAGAQLPGVLSVEVTDAAGHSARLPLSRFGVPRRPLEIHILRRRDEEQQRFPTQYELVLQTYVMPLADFVQASPQFDPAHLRSIRLVFDRLVAGTVVVDDIGVSATATPFVTLGEP